MCYATITPSPRPPTQKKADAAGHGMDAVGARRPRGCEHRVGVEVGRRRRRPAADLDRRVGEGDMLRARVGLAVHRDRVEAQRAGGVHDSACDFSSICYEEAFEVGEGHLCSLVQRSAAFFSGCSLAQRSAAFFSGWS